MFLSTYHPYISVYSCIAAVFPLGVDLLFDIWGKVVVSANQFDSHTLNCIKTVDEQFCRGQCAGTTTIWIGPCIPKYRFFVISKL